MDGQRRERLTRAVEEFTSAASGRAGRAQALCAAYLHVLPGVDGVALTLRAGARAEEMVGASDEWSALLEEIQYTLGEGPGIAAFRDAAPVLVADLGSDGVRWLGFSAAAVAEGLAATASRGGVRPPSQLDRVDEVELTFVVDPHDLARVGRIALRNSSGGHAASIERHQT